MEKGLHRKAAIVTGSTSGIGEAAARKLAAEGVGVVVTGRDAARGLAVAANIATDGGDALFVAGDLDDEATPGRLVAAARDQWGRLDIVVNNAALICHKPIGELTHRDWDRTFGVNVKSGFFLIQAALPLLKASRGCVVNVSSINGLLNDRGNLVYDVMKAALNHMTRGLALELRGEGVRVNAVLPGGVATPLLDSWLVQKLGDEERAAEAARGLDTAPNVASPQQIADAIVYLAGDGASWINGAVIPLTGGYSLGHPAP